MEDKYYTPNLDEFHVGFEYERCDSGYNWFKDIFPRAVKIEELSNMLIYTRVKHLDKEDIEECGWLYKPEGLYDSIDERERYSKYRPVFKDSELFKLGEFHLWIDNNDNTKIQIDKISGGVTTGIMRFWGIIKNKSELIKIMKMIGI
tara:strand:- start:1358 stop:1798 length:441 start_codon:yes stop_codon:yes gene_type:complete